MKLGQINLLEDKRIDCLSISTTVTTKDYLNFITHAYKRRGGIEFQREPLKTKSAIRIRERMIEDIGLGAILPSIVIGLIVTNEDYEQIRSSYKTSHDKESISISSKKIDEIIHSIGPDAISVIDGMQRTTALVESNSKGIISDEHQIRVDIWLSTETNSLIYRMLVLNSGQVPWNLRRQIEVIFSSMTKEIKNTIPEIEIMEIDDNARRSKPGQYQAKDIIELYLVYVARKEKVDIGERLADEFTRLDFIEATEKKSNNYLFYDILQYLLKFDISISRYNDESGESSRFVNGDDLFHSQPAKVGFITAIAKKVKGRPGETKTEEEEQMTWESFKKNLDRMLERIEKMSNSELGEYLEFQTLNEKLLKKTGKVGEFEREFFLSAFETLLKEEFNLKSLETSWLSN